MSFSRKFILVCTAIGILLLLLIILTQKKAVPLSKKQLQKELNINTPIDKMRKLPLSGTIFISGIKKPFGISVPLSTVYVSSVDTKILYAITDGKPQYIARGNGVSEVLENEDGTLYYTILNENKLIARDPKGVETVIRNDLSGPQGIVRNPEGTFYLTNYFDGTVVSMTEEGKDKRIVAENIAGPAGIAYRASDKSIIVASYAGNAIVVISTFFTKTIPLKKLTHIRSISATPQNTFLVTATLNKKGVIAEVKEDGTYVLRARTNLPDPLIGAFTQSGVVYVVSPNDPKGRILKIQL